MGEQHVRSGVAAVHTMTKATLGRQVTEKITEPGRCIVETRHARGNWGIIIEPDEACRLSRVREATPGLLVDHRRDGQPIRIEIAALAKASLVKVNRVLRELGFHPATRPTSLRCWGRDAQPALAAAGAARRR